MEGNTLFPIERVTCLQGHGARRAFQPGQGSQSANIERADRVCRCTKE